MKHNDYIYIYIYIWVKITYINSYALLIIAVIFSVRNLYANITIME